MAKVLNVITGGLLRDGITSTQLEYMRCIDKTDLEMDIVDFGHSLNPVKQQFVSFGCEIIKLPHRTKSPFAYVRALYKLLKKTHYDVIHVHGSSAILCLELVTAKVADVPVRIAHSRNTASVYGNVEKLLRPLFYRSYTHALACGQEAGEFLFPGRKFTVFHNGKDFEKFEYSQEMRVEKRKEFNFSDEIVFGFVGGLNKQKNPLFLIDVLSAALQDGIKAKLLVIGDGALRVDVEDYARTKGVFDRIIFTGRINNVNEMIQAADIMLLPSLYEGLPNVVLEWQISGLPTLVSDRVTTECAVTELVKYLPIDAGTRVWVDTIKDIDLKQDRKLSSERACIAMQAAGFEIHSSAERIKKLYLEGTI